MGGRCFIFLVSIFVLVGSVCASSSIIADEKKSEKASVESVKDGGDTKEEIVQNKDVYISEGLLYVKSPLIDDLIYVYTTSGLCIDKFVKDTELFVKDVSLYPNGILIVTNGKELTAKVVK